ncbi:probable RNA-dependent RNA polymerase 1 isoform X1 [Dendrobium catenatum]|uniref:probable RNA-dependent RNA polymerase 1 isoform X1 n=2 Tax=Dendrobium catenatum TaxID=906689 RepID=UPI0009F5982C|nr:probable RNA-dependent RNA polymerase 1 isoform X1 [Dendrobium catenatum]
MMMRHPEASKSGGKTIQVSGFPLNTTALQVTEFLEKFTGEGSVFALKLRHPKIIKATSKAFAIVQFVSSAGAIDIKNMICLRRLWFQGYYLTSKDVDHDIVPKPSTSSHVMEDVIVHFGCQIAENKLYILWTVKDVRIEFGFNLRKICLFISYKDCLYKLELFYESIWEIQLCHSVTQRCQFLQIQVQAAPKVYVMPPQNSYAMHEGPDFNYFKHSTDDQWIRTTDFTPSCSIGQSSTICLQLPYQYDLPNIKDNFVYFREDYCHLDLVKGSSYSYDLGLVPIVRPPHGFRVPYKILFKINHLVQNGTLIGPTLDENFFKLVNPSSVDNDLVERALEKMSYLKSSCFRPAKWLQEQYGKLQRLKNRSISASISLDDGLVYVHRVQVTPTKVYFYGPEINVSNRVVRNYTEEINNFIRVSFVDEDEEKMRSIDLLSRSGGASSSRRTEIYQRILSTLRNGITIGDKKFEFLAFSASQLRENSAWMFASSNGVTAAGIRNWMGNFSRIRNVAKYAARLGQSFGSSTETLTVSRDEVEFIRDIENSAGYIFSDGIGKISSKFARRVAIKCGLKSSTPSAFQIRYGGYKGVVAVDPMSVRKLSLRDSMCKYESENIKLDVLAYSKYQPCFLNRQLITLLSTLGVRDNVFEKKQDEVVNQLDDILSDADSAKVAIEIMAPGEITNVLKEMLMCGYKPDAEPFLSMMLQTYRASKLFELRTKSRIYVPKGRAMMGCLDETRILEYGEVFVQVSYIGNTLYHLNGLHTFPARETDQRTVVVKGKVVVAKNPCLHPGDVRILSAVDVPDLYHMVDCVVFPQKGERPHPNECSGSDLDGDIYFVCWDPELIPPRQASPMEYTAAPSETLDHDVQIEEVQEYFTNYIINDSLGVISNAHTVFADREPMMAHSPPCIELAELFSIAVDFPKTGVPAEIPPHLYVKEYPDFMEKPDKATYISKGVIGKLFRAVKDHLPPGYLIKSFAKEVAKRSYDPDMEVDGFMDYIDDAIFFKENYDFKLGNLMEHYGMMNEAELLTGNLMKVSRKFNKYRDGEAVRLAVKSLRKEVRSWLDEDNDGGKSAASYAKASACYHVTYHEDYWGTYNEGLKRLHFISFPWCAYDKLITIKKQNMTRRRVACLEEERLSHQMEQRLRFL